MSYLIDTDLLSLTERKNTPPKLLTWLSNTRDIFVSVVSMAELRHGAKTAPMTHRPALNAWISDLRRDYAAAIEPLDEAVLVRWKELLAELKSKNRTMTCEDSLIAATALHHGHTLATHNTRHFTPSGVALVDPLS